jgi:hypothetical protein
LSRFQNENRNHSCAFFAAKPQKTGLSASIFWLRQKDFGFNPLRPTGFKKWFNFGTGSLDYTKDTDKNRRER